MKQALFDHLKNIPGWKTTRKIVVFSVDDYGNVRLASKKAREAMKNSGIKAQNRFDKYDSLETREDLELLYRVLESVTDVNGKHAVFTPFAVSSNLNFEKIAETKFTEFHHEPVTQTFEKLEVLDPKAYQGVMNLWREGIQSGLMSPQFHGREHLNLKIFKEKLINKDHEVLTALRNRSYTGFSSSGYSTISPTAAFDFWQIEENNQLKKIIDEGLDIFEGVYGYKPVHFTPPVYSIHPELYETLKKKGVRYIDTSLVKKEHQGEGRYAYRFNYTGKRSPAGQYFVVRNVVFEPTDERGINWVAHALNQIETAFRWKRPAIISSHRVNFCGHIDPENRKKGLDNLRKLLKQITVRWPDVEFMAANELGNLISGRSS